MGSGIGVEWFLGAEAGFVNNLSNDELALFLETQMLGPTIHYETPAYFEVAIGSKDVNLGDNANIPPLISGVFKELQKRLGYGYAVGLNPLGGTYKEVLISPDILSQYSGDYDEIMSLYVGDYRFNRIMQQNIIEGTSDYYSWRDRVDIIRE